MHVGMCVADRTSPLQFTSPETFDKGGQTHIVRVELVAAIENEGRQETGRPDKNRVDDTDSSLWEVVLDDTFETEMDVGRDDDA